MKHEKLFSIFAIFLAVGLSAFILFAFREPKDELGSTGLNNLTDICFKEYCFSVELATTDQERARGLMYREAVNNNSGMLFIFNQPDRHSFWMKNTLIPLDIIWLNDNKQVVFINKNTHLRRSLGV